MCVYYEKCLYWKYQLKQKRCWRSTVNGPCLVGSDLNKCVEDLHDDDNDIDEWFHQMFVRNENSFHT